MTYCAALDVSLRSTHACVIDEAGEIVAESKMDSEAADIVAFLDELEIEIAKVGLEAGTLTQYLTYGLQFAGYRVVCMEARQVKNALSAMRNKTDKNDARGIAQLLRSGWYREVHIIGFVTALTFKAAVDDPARFKRSRTVAAHFGLTPRRFQSGELDLEGHISKCGDAGVRSTLYVAANAMMTRSSRWSSLKAWGMQLAKTRGHRRAVIAVARKLAVILHRMWVDDTQFRWGTEPARS